MTKWVYKWSNNGWTNSEGSEVANRDLIEEALNRDNLLKEKGDVYNVWMTGHLHLDHSSALSLPQLLLAMI